jgi:hypothetical protein
LPIVARQPTCCSEPRSCACTLQAREAPDSSPSLKPQHRHNNGNSVLSTEGGSTFGIASVIARLTRPRRGGGERRQWCARGRRWREGRAANL